MNWKRASEITEPGAYWVDDRRPDGKKPSPPFQYYVVQVLEAYADWGLHVRGASITKHGEELKYWDKNIYLFGPIEPPEVEGKK